jgi:hypothetical protein
MGTQGEIAIGARGRLSYAEELNWGVPLPPTHRVDFKTESLTNEQGDLRSEALNPSRGVARRVRGTSNISGDIAIEQSTEGYETWYKHALGDRVTINKADGGIRTRVTAVYVGGAGTLNVEDTAAFQAGGGDWALTVIYKDASGLLVTAPLVYSAKGATTFTLGASPLPPAIHKGAWIIQRYAGVQTWWNSVYTHYIEAAATLPQGICFEVGRDLAYFVYSGCKANQLEGTFTAQEILQATFSWIGRAEYSGADLKTATTSASTEIELTNFAYDYRSASGPIGYAKQDDGAVFTDETTAANNDTANDVNFFAAGGTALNDAYYFGSDEVFTALELKISTPAIAPDWTVVWEYYNGSAWVTLPMTVNAFGVMGMLVAGNFVSYWTAPANWAKTTVDTDNAYYIRMRVTVPGVATTYPLGQRVWLGPGIVGFAKTGKVQVESENGILYTGIETEVSTGVAKLTGVSNWMSGSNHAVGVPVGVQQTWGSSVEEPPDVNPLSSFEAAVYIDGSAQEVLSGSFTLNNNLYADKYQLGDKFRAGLPEQQRTVEGTLNVEFDDLTLYHRFINGTAGLLEFRCVDETELIGTNTTDATADVYRQLHYIFPNIQFTGTTPVIGGPDQIVHDMNFVALVDADNQMNELGIFFVNKNSSI